MHFLAADRLFVLLQHVLPQHALSAVMYRVSRCQTPWFAHSLIRLFCGVFSVNLTEAAETEVSRYPSFNAFFTRALRDGARAITAEPKAVVSPADGCISQIGALAGQSLLQAKGRYFDVTSLLGGVPERAAPYVGGSFVTIYLSPKDYHRLHMPVGGQLTEMIHIPGRLFSVNEATSSLVPGLFARNERVVTCFDTAAGPMALVLIGAIFVGSIETVWHGEITPAPRPRRPQSWRYGTSGPYLARGAEMGRFNMGSTVIVLFGPGAVTWTAPLRSGDGVRMGGQIGEVSC